MTFKIIRTIIGLPLILINYLPMLIGLALVLGAILVVRGVLHNYEKTSALELLASPSRFIKKVWSKDV